jgi:predicted DsbA family dithiol-disulfide isomerase
MADEIKIGDRVQVYLQTESQGGENWFDGVVVRIDPYSAHRSFFWVKLDEQSTSGGLISVLNPRNIRKT